MTQISKSTPAKPLLYPSAQVYDWGTTLAVAPYPDHQILGCGGSLALLRQMGYRVRTLFLGGRPSAVHATRDSRGIGEETSRVAIAQLGISEEASACLRIRDGLFPHQNDPGFEESTRLVINELQELEPDTVLLPKLTHDQPDLLATWQIIRKAVQQFASPLRIIEYVLLEQQLRGTTVTKPTAEHTVWRLDIKEVMDRKAEAVQLFQKCALLTVSPADMPSWEVYVEYAG
jgi:LmbE family N-acetylglucosaminyl deacetylase